MLNQEEAKQLYNEITIQQKNAMKKVLNNARMALDEEKFKFFKKLVFDTFGVSGLETSTYESIKKITEAGE